MKRYVALARVSSREQEREGFSLDVQEKALKRYAQKQGGQIVKPFRIAETASKKEERAIFREMIAYVRKHAKEIDGLLFYKVDRAARNLKDYLMLEELETDLGVPFVSVSQPVEDNPAGRLMRRTLATMAAFFSPNSTHWMSVKASPNESIAVFLLHERHSATRMFGSMAGASCRLTRSTSPRSNASSSW